MGKLFGTDGVRGVANTELTCDMAYKIGVAAAFVLTRETHHSPKIIIGKIHVFPAICLKVLFRPAFAALVQML